MRFRAWHRWAGVAAALFLIVVSLTGMVLNYKKPVFHALGLEPRPATSPPEKTGSQPPPKAPPRHAGNLLDQPIPLSEALAVARQQWGDSPLERVELKLEQGRWLYKIKRHGGAELWVFADTGEQWSKGEYEKLRPVGGSQPAKSFDWGKFLLDLHTGKIGGPVGVALMTAMGGVLFFLTLSGMYLWLKPLLIRRANAAARAAETAARHKSPGVTASAAAARAEV